MSDLLRDIRISRTAFLLLACASAAATAVILAGGGDRSSAQLAALAAIHSPPLSEQNAPRPRVPTVAASSGAEQSGGSAGGSTNAPGGSSSPPSAQGAPPAAVPLSTEATTTPASGSGSAGTNGSAPAPDAGLPHVGHVFLITLSTRSYADTFGRPSQAPYLRALVRRGTELTGFHSLASAELPNLLAMVSGQAPNRSTEGGCSRYTPFPASAAANASGIVPGHGCVYPDTALTIADQTTSAGKSWGAYIADAGKVNCPVPNTGDSLSTPIGGTQPGYDLLHNPFAFFGSLLDAGACSSGDQDLSALPKALRRASSTPSLTYLGAGACADGDPEIAAGASTVTTGTTATSTTPTSTTPTSTTPASTAPASTPATTSTPAAVGCPEGARSGIPAENAFLKTWVPQILRSPGYRKNGVLVIAFAGDGGRPTARTGALVLSRWTARGRRLPRSYGPYSLLRSLEDMLDLTPLAHAASAQAFAEAVL